MGDASQNLQFAMSAVKLAAAKYRIPSGELRFIGGYSNFMIAFGVEPIVARVVNASKLVRSNLSWMKREVEIASFLEECRFAATRTSKYLPPGPHKFGEFSMTFWQFLDSRKSQFSPIEAGFYLRELHQVLATCPIDLPVMDPLKDAWRLLNTPSILRKLHHSQRDLVVKRARHIREKLASFQLNLRPLHGDAHRGNLVDSGQGKIWTDFEYAHLGPVEWDIACITNSSRVFGKGVASQAVLDGYKSTFDDYLLDVLVEARSLQFVAWGAALYKYPLGNARIARHLEWLGERTRPNMRCN